MLSFNWAIIIPTTIVLYVLTILFLPFNAVMATIMLFSLIAFWSRLPAGCIMEPFPVMYFMDFVDIFCIIIAIYVGPFEGAVFALVWNIYPRLAGAFRPWLVFFKDGASQAILCLFMPLTYTITGSLVTTVLVFSIVRLFLYLAFSLVMPTRPLVEQIIHIFIAGFIVALINVFYAKIFGDFFTDLLKKGATFSWILFLIATIIILAFAIIVYGYSPKKTIKSAGKGIIKISKKIKQKSKRNANNNSQDEEFEHMKRIQRDLR